MACFQRVLQANATIPLLGVILTLASPTMNGQVVNATLAGRVIDTSGAVVPSAMVKATNNATGTVRSTTTTGDGLYTLPFLDPGTYHVEAEAPGFKKFSRNDVVLNVSTTAHIDVTLEPGNITETITVSGEPPVLQTDSAEIAQNFGSKTIVDLPIANRNFQALAGLSAGVSPPAQNIPAIVDPAQTTFFQANGQGNAANNTIVDGVDNLEPILGVNIYLPSPELVSEVHVTTSNFAAEFGRAGGATINVVTRSGTNEFHGSAWEFNRVAATAARDFFNKTPSQQPGLTRNDFGATSGGPVVKNKTFFYGAYQGRYIRQSTTNTSTVPVSDWLSGNMSAAPGLNLYNPATGNPNGTGRARFPNDVIPASALNPIATKLASYFPQPNLPGFLNNYVVSIPNTYNGNSFDGRVDHNISEQTKLFAKANTSHYKVTQGGVLGPIVGDGLSAQDYTVTGTIGVTHGFSPTLLTELRLGFNRYRASVSGQNTTQLTNAQLGIFNPNPDSISTQGIASIQINSMPAVGTPVQYPLVYTDNLFNIANNWSKNAGKHNLKWGVEVHRDRLDQFQAQGANLGSRGLFVFNPGTTQLVGGPGLGSFGAFANSFASFLIGAADLVGRTYLTTTPTNRQTQFFTFVQDKFQVSPRLTLDLGLRYELYTTIKPRGKGGASNYDPITNTLLIAGYGDVGLSTGVNVQPYNFAPRVGFAYRLSDNSVLRGGYGISYWSGRFGFTGGTLSTQFPVVNNIQQGVAGDSIVDGSLNALPAVPAINIPSNGRISPAPNQAFFVIPAYNPIPYVESYNLVYQRQFGHGFNFDLGYVGNVGRQLPYYRELNAAVPGTGSAGLPLLRAFGRNASTQLRADGVNSNYNSFQANLGRRFASGYSFTLAYTFSKCLDVGSNEPTIRYNLNLQRQYGPCDYDQTHLLTASHQVELPFGNGKPFLNQGGVLAHILSDWQLNGVFRIATGTPFTATADATSCNCPGNSQYADAISPVTYLGGVGPGQPWFTTASFTPPGPNLLGNAGRNTIRGPRLTNYDLSLFRNFALTERFRLQFRAEAYNLTNTPHFSNPTGNASSATFGIISSTNAAYPNRQLQGALRLMF